MLQQLWVISKYKVAGSPWKILVSVCSSVCWLPVCAHRTHRVSASVSVEFADSHSLPTVVSGIQCSSLWFLHFVPFNLF